MGRVFLAIVSAMRGDLLVFMFELMHLSGAAYDLVMSVQKCLMCAQSQVPECSMSVVCANFGSRQTFLSRTLPCEANSVDHVKKKQKTDNNLTNLILGAIDTSFLI